MYDLATGLPLSVADEFGQKKEFESDGDLLNVTSKKTGTDVFRPYVSNFSYTASGGISQMKLGNGKWEKAKFNNRLQVTELGLGSSAANAGLWKVNYDYGELNTDGTVDTAKNTGNIAKQTLTIPGTSFVQAYKYDALYRLTEAKETTGANQNWTQNWTYDQFANRLSFAQNINGAVLNTTPAISQNTNRFTSTDFGYDANGNIVTDHDPVTALTRQFTFNGDNKQTEVISNGVSIGQYFYDGEGKRVKKVTNSETTVFVYSSGKLVAEYSTQLSQSPTISYTTTDHLGSPRIITNALGQVQSRRDFMPFGEDMQPAVGNRSANSEYTVGDQVRQKFTGYLKDNETGLDFAEARMYENRFGRFTAIDPLLASGKSANPQTFNRFVYVGNNPIARVDRTGLDWLFTIANVEQGDSVIKVYNPVWVDGRFPSGSVPRGYDGRWEDSKSLVYEITAGERKGQFAALDPNSARSFLGTESDARLQLDVYSGKVSEFDAAAARMAWNSEGNAKPLLDSVNNNPQFQALERLTNPDGATLNVQAPFGLGGVGGWFNKDGYYGYSTSAGGATPTDFIQGMRNPNFNPFSVRNLLGGVSFSTPYILENGVDERQRVNFFTGRSVNVSVCYYLCAGGTITDPDQNGNRRFSFNPGVGLPSAGGNISEGVCVGNFRNGKECPK